VFQIFSAYKKPALLEPKSEQNLDQQKRRDQPRDAFAGFSLAQ
jgi:hypothetical protein